MKAIKEGRKSWCGVEERGRKIKETKIPRKEERNIERTRRPFSLLAVYNPYICDECYYTIHTFTVINAIITTVTIEGGFHHISSGFIVFRLFIIHHRSPLLIMSTYFSIIIYDFHHVYLSHDFPTSLKIFIRLHHFRSFSTFFSV